MGEIPFTISYTILFAHNHTTLRVTRVIDGPPVPLYLPLTQSQSLILSCTPVEGTISQRFR